MSEVNESARPVVTRGGTYFICHQDTVVITRRPKLNKLGHKTRYTEIVETVVPDCGRRFRISRGTARFLRHSRREHGDA